MSDPSDPQTHTNPADPDAVPMASALSNPTDQQTAASAAPEPPPAGEIGRLGKYRVLKRLGKGGMGAVYLGYDDALARRVALKLMLPKYAARTDARQRFTREARTAAQVKNDHVVTIHDVGEDNGIPFIAMEYLQGMPLDQFLAGATGLTLAQVVRVGREVAEGLAAAHGKGLIHRDIKPANLWLEYPEGRVKILDFGLAREEEEIDHPTRTGDVLGTPAYMSPEQARGDKLDARSDLFSLGVVLYRLCTGRLPFPGATTMAILTNLATLDPDPVRSLNPEVSEALAGLVHRLLSKDRTARPATAREVAGLLAALEAAPAGDDVPMATAIADDAGYAAIGVGIQPESVWGHLDEPSTPGAAVATMAKERSGTHTLAGTRWVMVGLAVGVIAIFAGVAVLVRAMRPDPGVKPDDTPVVKGEPAPKQVVKKDPPPPPPPGPDQVAAEFLHLHAKLSFSFPDGRPALNEVPPTDPLPLLPYTVARIQYLGELNPNREAVLTAIGALPAIVSFEDFSNRLALADSDMDRLSGLPMSRSLSSFAVSRFRLSHVTPQILFRFPELARLRVDIPGAEPAVVEAMAANLPWCRLEFPGRLVEPLAKADPSFVGGPGLPGWTRVIGDMKLEGNDLVLGYTGGSEGKTGSVHTTRHVRDFLLTFQIKVNSQGTSLVFRGHGRLDLGGGTTGKLWSGGKGERVPVAPGTKVTREVFRPDDFNDVIVICRGDKLLVRVNGTVVTDQLIPWYEKGVVGWRVGPGRTDVRLRGLRFAEFPPPASEVLTSPDYAWTTPEPVRASNGPDDDSQATQSADRLSMVFASTRGDAKRARLFEARRKSVAELWNAGTALDALNHPTAATFQPYLTADGLTLLFASDRPEGSSDLWVAHRASRDAAWGTPESIVLNGVARRGTRDPALSPDGNTLYFIQTRPDGTDTDIWACRRASPAQAWGKAEPMDVVNGLSNEGAPRPTDDGRGLVFSRISRDDPPRLSWHLATLDADGNATRVVELDPEPESPSAPGTYPTPSADGTVVYFSTTRAEGVGGLDVWQVRRVPRPATPPKKK